MILLGFSLEKVVLVQIQTHHKRGESSMGGESDTNGCSSKGTLLSYYVERIMERAAKGSDYDVGCDGRSE